ncbi:head GIN domain-containing protein [Cytophaga sp. FL35]|uniref:head GIN domain-containing protein n=1 Tax=Cytophaga sp. FL35 TaxID=1904456 RepID=UPI001653DE64|nr:head GIN domain-containing protein [Cytophaga sp. FL35]MBC7000179.1 DUF2807 domain-containing protein [Cytophaga sp. FL35]
MKTKSIILFAFGLLLTLSSCDYEHVRADDEITTRNLTMSGFSGLEVGNAFDVYITFSDAEEEVIIEANDNLHDRIIVAREGDQLSIKLKKFTTIKGNATLKAYITTSYLDDIDLKGASTVIMENAWEVNRAKIDLSGSSEIRGEILSNHFEVDMKGASKADIFGNVESLYVDLAGASDMRDYDLIAKRLNIDLSGASEAFLTVSESIDIEASGASVLNYKGDAVTYHKELKGASRLKNRN